MKNNRQGFSFITVLLVSLLVILSAALFYKFNKPNTKETEITGGIYCELMDLPDQQFDTASCNKFIEKWRRELLPTLEDKVITQIVALDNFYAIRVTPKQYEPTFGPNGKVEMYFFDNTHLTRLANQMHDVLTINDIRVWPDNNRLYVRLQGGAHVATLYLINLDNGKAIPFTDPNNLLPNVAKQTGIPFGNITNEGTINVETLDMIPTGFKYRESDAPGKYTVDFEYNLNGELVSANVN